MKNTLIIDTTAQSEIIVELKTDDKNLVEKSGQRFGSQVLLGLIDQVLRKAQIDKSDLTEVKVMTGPGSFTGIRVGVAVANALGYALKIPVNGKIREDQLIYS